MQEVCSETHFRGAYSFVLLKPPVVYKHLICLEFKDLDIYSSNVWEKSSSSIKNGHKILQNEDLCYLRTLGLISVVIFAFFIFVSMDYLYL